MKYWIQEENQITWKYWNQWKY